QVLKAAGRAARAPTEAATRLSDRAEPVPDDIWGEAARHYDEKELAALILSIALINVWNRLNVVTRQVAGEWAKSAEARAWVESGAGARGWMTCMVIAPAGTALQYRTPSKPH